MHLKKIMVVDDEPDIISTIKVIFKSFSNKYEVIGANSGKQCLEFLENKKIPDLILMDIMMPGMNGWDVVAKLKKNPKWSNIPIIFLTVKNDTYSKTFGGIVSVDYITKPFEVKDLKESVDKILEG